MLLLHLVSRGKEIQPEQLQRTEKLVLQQYVKEGEKDHISMCKPV